MTSPRPRLRSAEEEIADSPIALTPIAAPDLNVIAEEEAAPPEGLRARTARGVLVNTGFRVGLAGIGLLRNVGIAALVTATEFGVWSLILVTLVTLAFLKEVGIADKYIQQREPDQLAAFQKAFTLEVVSSAIFFGLVLVVFPIYALIVYDRPEILLPGLVLSLSLFALALQAPTWIFYRRMDYVRQRSIEAVDPIVTTFAMLALVAGGAGIWGLAVGGLIGSIAGAVVAVLASPYPLAWRFDRSALREYFSFSWPLFLGGFGGLLVVQGTLIIGNAALGLAAVGAIGLAGTFAQFSSSLEQLLNQTLYPAVCRVQERGEVLRDAFVTSNRLSLIWALPFGFGLCLFADDLAAFVLGPTWDEAVPLIQAFGLIVAFGTVAFAWSTFLKARGETRPIAVAGVISVAVFFVVTVPLMLTVGIIGYGIGMGAATIVQLGVRAHYLRRLFPGFNLAAHAARAVAPVIPAVAGVVALRVVLAGGERLLEEVLAELAVYIALVLGTVYAFERPLIKEAIGYLRARGRGSSGLSGAGAPAS